ncbi:MAG: hypothetical protein PVI90_19855, partial [Desulfobacteraceae bacterium]
MSIQVNLQDIQNAWESRDPQLPGLINQLSRQANQKSTAVHKDAPTLDKFISEINSAAFRRKSKKEKTLFRIAQIKMLESDDAEAPLTDRLQLHKIIITLWQDNKPFARNCLLEVIATVKLTYGPWRALKRIYKEAEAREDTQIMGALAARFDMAVSNKQHSVSQRTLGYMCRRAWRYLRRTAESLPVFYTEAVSDYLVWYTDQTNWNNTWIANHIFFHATGEYSRKIFWHYSRKDISLTKDRAYPDLWRRTPRPLFALLECARSERVRQFAVQCLKSDFKTTLRDIEPAWVARIIRINSEVVHKFAIWILNHAPRLEQAAFRKLRLHEAVLTLFDSKSATASIYAANYARTYARDLSLDHIIRLIHNPNEAVRKLAFDLLSALNPRKQVGLSAWGRILKTQYGHNYAAQILRKHFGARDLTPDWFKARLLSGHNKTIQFAKELLPQVHPHKKLGTSFFIGLLEDLIEIYPDNSYQASNMAVFALNQLAQFDINGLDKDFLKRMFVHPIGARKMAAWVDEGRLKAQTLEVPFYKALAYFADWEKDPWIKALQGQSESWAAVLKFNEELSEQVLDWLTDIRRFSPQDIGFDWLMTLVERSDPKYHNFAVNMLIKSFTPADFAHISKKTEPDSPGEEITVDFENTSFLFTGKMATMPRKTAQTRVKQANGKIASGVSPNLNYLVIGDEGSPLYGSGRKGSKQVKAENLNTQGGKIKIISETAFLKMLSGRKMESSSSTALAGCERLWNMAIADGKEDDPKRRFAVKYLRRRHPDICLAETDRPVDPGAEIPETFLSFERVKPLFLDQRRLLRNLALAYAQWEFARWNPSPTDLIQLCESTYPRVRQFITKALLAEDNMLNKRFRLDALQFSPDAIYAFCESTDDATRELGIMLIRQYPQFQLPDELFRLTESPDRRMRAFVIRTIRSLYRRKGVTPHWQPRSEDTRKVKKDPPDRSTIENKRLTAPFAKHGELYDFLRRILFEIPPARYAKLKEEDTISRLKPLPTRKAKLAIIEVMRDLAIEDKQFAKIILRL